ncbi:M16 family metallopeptidase [Candidatus Mycalebacterium sp.]
MSVVFCAEVDVLAAKEISSVTRVKLKNGLTVILEPNHSSPVAAINVWVKVGSACEGAGEGGIAHFREHMFFKGTSTLASGELALEVESSGGRINAHTSFDQTVYHITGASRSLDRSIDLLADSVTNPVFDPGEIKKEIEVVLEEIRRDKDFPESVMSKRLFASAYEKHPYGLPILGTAKSVSSFTRGKVLGFNRKWYSPSNMVVVVTGDFEKSEVLARVKKRFGTLKERKAASCSVRETAGRKSPSVSVLKKEVNEGYFGLAFRIPGLKGEDVAALDVVSEAMGEGESSRLFRVVREEKGLVNNIYSYAYAPRMGGIFVVSGTVKPENAVAAYEEILRMFLRARGLGAQKFGD